MEKDGKAMFLIHQCVSSEIFKKNMRYENAMEIWDTLEILYSRDGKLKKVRLQAGRRQYEMLTMEEGESISQYFDKLVNLANQIRKE